MTAPGHNLGAPEPADSTPVSTATIPVVLPITAKRVYFAGSPVLRRIVFVIGYEGFSLLFTIVVLGALLGHGGGESSLTAVLLTLTATGWNYLWNMIFEAIERRTGVTGRGPLMRAIHAFGYEGGVLIFTIPLVALMLHVSLLEALVIESSLLVFFLIFTAAYTWAFDKVFGLPTSL